MNPQSICVLTSVVLGLFLAIPPNTCIVMVNLRSLRKEGKLSPSDVIFMVKGMVNILLQVLVALMGMFYVLPPAAFSSIINVHYLVMSSGYFLTYFSFWMTVWLSAHYCTNITNLRCRFFIWIKRIVSNFLSRVLFLTALGIFPLSVLSRWTFTGECHVQCVENSTETSLTNAIYFVNYRYFVPVTSIGCMLPFSLSLLCLLLTFSFLVRHVWRVKNNDSGSSQPNLQAYVTALRTIFFLLLVITSFSMSQVLIFITKPKMLYPMYMFSWCLRVFSPLAETAVIFQASNKLKSISKRRFWTLSWRNTET